VRARFTLLLGALVLAPACREAPDVTEIQVPPDALDAEGSLYSNFSSHRELLEPPLLAFLEEAEAYVDAGETGCYRIEPLSRCDVAGLCRDHPDPSDISSAVHAERMDGVPEEFEAALLEDDWTTVFGAWDTWERRDETGRSAYLSGERELYGMVYAGALNVGLAFSNVLQFRRIPDWNGTGHPLVLIRGYQIGPAISSNESISMESQYSLELLVPLDDGSETLRVTVNWSGLTIGTMDSGTGFGLACSLLRDSYTDLQDWVVEQRD
jgi:hypothetical protein